MSDDTEKEAVREGQVAAIHYVGRIAEGPEEGEVFDTTNVDVALEEGIYHDHRDYKPLEFRLGEDKVIEGLDEAVVGMERGEKKTVVVEPERAFGERDPDDVVEFPRETFDEKEIEVGTLAATEDGKSGWVTEVDDVQVHVGTRTRRVHARLACDGRTGTDTATRNSGSGRGPPRDRERQVPVGQRRIRHERVHATRCRSDRRGDVSKK
jgi:FKBP-type peptidyl-prolyl cis-trans isomerase 2